MLNKKYDILSNIKEGGTLLLNTNLKEEDLIKSQLNSQTFFLFLNK